MKANRCPCHLPHHKCQHLWPWQKVASICVANLPQMYISLKAGEWRQPRTAHTLHLPQAGVPRASVALHCGPWELACIENSQGMYDWVPEAQEAPAWSSYLQECLQGVWSRTYLCKQGNLGFALLQMHAPSVEQQDWAPQDWVPKPLGAAGAWFCGTIGDAVSPNEVEQLCQDTSQQSWSGSLDGICL